VELPFLIHLPSRVISEFLSLSTTVRHAAGSTLLLAGDRVSDLHVLTSGEVEVIDPARPSASQILGAGECFAELALMKECPSPVTVRARTPVAVARLPRQAFENLAGRHAELRSYLGLRVTRASQPPVPLIGSSGTVGLSGSLKSLAFADVIQFLQVSGKTGVLSLEKGAQKAEVHFENGDVRHARSGSLEGEKAFYQLALWKDGAFSFDATPAGHGATIRLPTMTLLMEAMRLADEAEKDGARKP
jgi:CRP-like cAMP-binding protein